MTFDIPKWLQVIILIIGTAGTGLVFYLGAGMPPLDFSIDEIAKIISLFIK